MTDVPYGRGGSPLQNLIVAGQTETKVTALKMVDEMDAGPVYAKRSMSMEGRAEDIYLRAGDLCWEMIRWMIAEEPVPQPQQGEVTKFIRRKPE
jgi:methionyl-tRNA formyltransferase